MNDIVQEIKNRRILPALGLYVGGCWVLIEILDRLSERYLLSPYITDAAFWGLYSLIPAVILQESFLAFIGLTVEFGGRTLDSWGSLVNQGRQALTSTGGNWWVLLFPSLAMAVTLFSLNFIGDGLKGVAFEHLVPVVEVAKQKRHVHQRRRGCRYGAAERDVDADLWPRQRPEC